MWGKKKMDEIITFLNVEYKSSYLFHNLPYVAHIGNDNSFYFLNKNYKTIGNTDGMWETYPDIGPYKEIYFFDKCFGYYPWTSVFYDKTLFDQLQAVFPSGEENRKKFQDLFSIENYVSRVESIIKSGKCVNNKLPFFHSEI